MVRIMSKKKRINKKNRQNHPENDSNDSQAKQDQALGFEKAKTMTIGELNQQKDSFDNISVTGENENSLDETKTDSNILSEYIKSHQHTSEKTAKEKAIETQTQSRPYIPNLDDESPSDDVNEQNLGNKNNRLFKWISLALIVIALIAGFVYAWNFSHNDTTAQSTNTTQLAEKVKQFKAKIQAFYIDQANGQLKNEAFTNLDSIKSELKDYTDYKDYASLEKDVNTLSQEVQAIEQVNQYFNQSVIVDGNLVNTVTVKENQNLQVPEIKNEKLKALLTQAIDFGKAQQSEISTLASQLETLNQTGIDNASLTELQAAESLYNSTSAPIQSQYQSEFSKISAQVQTLTEAAQKAAQASAASQAASTSSSTDSSTTSANSSVEASDSSSSTSTSSVVSAAERQKSRVPYDQTKIDDVNNSAWTWGEGIKEKVIALCQSRGYIGSDYILEKVNIINDNGYYNLFSADGRYLVSINCKTGYFVGNGSGHSDDLDY